MIYKDAVEKMVDGIKSLATPLQDLILNEAMTDRDYANKAAAELAGKDAELLALRERVAKLKLAIVNALNSGEPKALKILEEALKSQ